MIKRSLTDLRRFILVAFIEGVSYLILLLIAMPLKYYGNTPEVVKYAGWAHGVLFVLFCYYLLKVWIGFKWSFWKTMLAFIASLVPFGTFLLDYKLKHEYPELTRAK